MNNKIIITGTVIGGAEAASVVQWYKTTTTQFDIQNGLEGISMSSTEKACIYYAMLFIFEFNFVVYIFTCNFDL